MAKNDFVKSLFKKPYRKSDPSSRETVELQTKEEYHIRIRNALYVKFIDGPAIFREIRRLYGPTFVKLGDKIVKNKKGEITSHQILVKQCFNVPKIMHKTIKGARVTSPYKNWVEICKPSVKVSTFWDPNNRGPALGAGTLQ